MQRIEKIICALIALSILILDRTTKYFVLKSNDYLLNNGAVFGFGLNLQVIIVSSLLLLGIAVYLLIKERKKLGKIALTAIIMGLLLNTMDRIVYGGTIDFIDFKIFPLFNVADASITLGIIALALSLFVKHGRKP